VTARRHEVSALSHGTRCASSAAHALGEPREHLAPAQPRSAKKINKLDPSPCTTMRLRTLARHLTRVLLFLSVWIGSGGCYQNTEEGDYYAFYDMPKGVWQGNTSIRFQLLFPDRESLYQIQIALRLDSRIEKTELALLAELQRGNSTYYTDTLHFRLADQPEVWLRPGTVFHEYKAGLARPLQMPYTGLFYLRLTPLGRVTLTGVSAVGVGMKERPKTN
jgi:hypothetical protein